MTPFKMGLSRSFNIPGDAGMCCGSLTPVTSVARSQQVTTRRWHHPVPFSPLPLQGLDPLSTEQAAKIYQLATECQALGSDLAKQFQTICRLKASHHTIAQATTHETVLFGCLIHSAAYAVATTTQQAEEWESTLGGLCNARATNLLSHKLACMHGRAGSNKPSPSRVASPTSSAAHHSPASSCPRTPSLGTNIVRSHSNSASSHSSQTTELKLPARSQDEGSEDSKSICQDDSKTNEVGGDDYEDKAPENGKAKVMRTLTPKALKNPAVILESQTLRVATVPQKLMVRFRPMQSCQQETQGDTSAKGDKANDPKSLCPPHSLMPTTRTLKRSGNVSITRMPSFWIRTLVCGALA